MSVGEQTTRSAVTLPAELTDWLQANADQLDSTPELASEVVPRLAGAGLFAVGVPQELGGSGGATIDAIDAIAAVAEYSVTAAFVFWGQRTFIEYLLQSPNEAMRARWIGPLMRGEFAGATGLSNAMKFLSGIESLQITATPNEQGWQLDGSLAWITNLRKEGFIAAAAVNSAGELPPAVVAFVSDGAGVTRSPDLELMALRGSNTAAVKIEGVQIGEGEVLHRTRAPGCRACVRPSWACSAACRSAWRAPACARRTACRPPCAAPCSSVSWASRWHWKTWSRS
jgi:alkylation response protein AidB-like acyl-CoA dehydrogenase